MAVLDRKKKLLVAEPFASACSLGSSFATQLDWEDLTVKPLLTVMFVRKKTPCDLYRVQ